MQSSDREKIDPEDRAVVQPILVSPRGSDPSNRWRCACAAAIACGWLFWFGGRFQELPEPELVSQPPAARTARSLTGSANETLDGPSSGTPGDARAERAQRRKARKEAARAKREAARERRAEASRARREASQSKREAARERREAAKEARRESAESRRATRMAKREEARERHAAAVQARRDAAEARREAAREKREQAQAHDAAPAPRNMGILRINSLPWAQVFVDGRLVGYTPQRGISLTPGDHAVRLINPEFSMSKTLQVRIRKGQEITRREMLE